ncbi:adenosine deaminase/editase [Bombardia bombarda]|uniref:Adenosine deaminase/editase n=1 Tax=Bombardia bombarda TaxID=252184 RepID=A0AA39WCL5_9PEZI|nr:adenosine deaminase/editase [Bombardia bombarda]
MKEEGDLLALAVLGEFAKLPSKRKPSVRDNGLHEWVPLSGIVAKGPGFLKCVALATGMKCLPASKLPKANGVALHDWHAEVLAVRAFNHFILEECRRLIITPGYDGDDEVRSDFLRRRTDAEITLQQQHQHHTENAKAHSWHGQAFAWREDVTLHMYCSEAPCGDASMELIMAAQEDASPWDITPPSLSSTPPHADGTSTPTPTPTPPPSLPGRGFFSQLGVVRRKPARGDAPPTLSKSCSDKIALKQCTSLLSSLGSLFVSPQAAYLTSLILPTSQFSPGACRRSFSAEEEEETEEAGAGQGRMRPLANRHWGGGYAFVPFRVETTSLEFDFSKHMVSARSDKTGASNLAVAWTALGCEEGLVGGVLQGRKQFDQKGASLVSRRRMWSLAREVAGSLSASASAATAGGEITEIAQVLAEGAYDEVKEGGLLGTRRRVKGEARAEALKGWFRNTGDGEFGL